jgi:tRNA G18 (ribose-2'-O)-methylase SpoU
MGSRRVERVADPEDARLDPYRNVRDPTWMRRRDIFLAEGRTVVEILLGSPRFQLRSLLLTETALASLEHALGSHTLPVYLVARETLECVAGARFHQGCVAVAEIPPTIWLDELLRISTPRRWLVLEAVSDPDNMGGLFRNALAFGVDAVLLGPGCSHPLYRKATRTALGATLQVPFGSVREWPGDLEHLGQVGVTRIALTPRPEALDIAEFGSVRPVPDRIALFLGDEGYGLSDAALAACDLQVRIPMASGVDSLNVATAAGIALHCLASHGQAE